MTDDKSTSTTKSESTPKAAAPASEGTAKPEGSTPANYTRGENQKPVTGSYKENWNAIYGKKTKPPKPTKTKTPKTTKTAKTKTAKTVTRTPTNAKKTGR
jgi:hypothetical protein